MADPKNIEHTELFKDLEALYHALGIKQSGYTAMETLNKLVETSPVKILMVNSSGSYEMSIRKLEDVVLHGTGASRVIVDDYYNIDEKSIRLAELYGKGKTEI